MSWIWLPEEQYPALQSSLPAPGQERVFAAAEFTRSYAFDRFLDHLELTVSGDVTCRLSLNGQPVWDGPVLSGGDFLCPGPPPAFYSQSLILPVSGRVLDFHFSAVLGKLGICDYTAGHGGVLLEGRAVFADGSSQPISTDESWYCRPDPCWIAPLDYDAAQPLDAPVPAAVIPDLWHCRPSGLPPMCQYPVRPIGQDIVAVPPGETVEVTLPFDKIYPAYITLDISGSSHVTAYWYEVPEIAADYERVIVSTDRPVCFRSLRFYSVGALRLVAHNPGSQPVYIRAGLVAVHYPITQEGHLRCSDPELEKVYNVCKWALTICRQTIHLDSPRHQEPLACTGDYYIQALMTAFTFGDMELAKLDLRRTADWLVMNNGRMFHTTYSLIWVQMLLDVYRFTGDMTLLTDCAPALRLLLNRFESYLGDNGLLEHCPDYMFIDWNTVDGYNMHHPPKYLGQTCMCMFCYGALHNAAEVYGYLAQPDIAADCRNRADTMKQAMDTLLYDPSRGLYIDGLPTPDGAEPGDWLPKNTPGRHFSKHANVLAVLYGVRDGEEGRRILRKVLADDTLPDIQPYFMHFVLDAVHAAGLDEEMLLPLLERWKPIVQNCDKGLQEGWFSPGGEGCYGFDYSHAWGGTPAYQLPARLLGFTMLEPGFKRIRLNPRLLGLDWADISLPTPYGYIRCVMKDGSVDLQVPPKIRVEG